MNCLPHQSHTHWDIHSRSQPIGASHVRLVSDGRSSSAWASTGPGGHVLMRSSVYFRVWMMCEGWLLAKRGTLLILVEVVPPSNSLVAVQKTWLQKYWSMVSCQQAAQSLQDWLLLWRTWMFVSRKFRSWVWSQKYIPGNIFCLYNDTNSPWFDLSWNNCN